MYLSTRVVHGMEAAVGTNSSPATNFTKRHKREITTALKVVRPWLDEFDEVNVQVSATNEPHCISYHG